MTLGTKTDAEKLAYIGDRFRARKAAVLGYEKRSLGRVSTVQVTLIPDFLIKDAEDCKGLMIVVEGGGAYTWDGLGLLSPLTLITAGFRPLSLATQLAILLNTFLATERALIAAPTTAAPVSIGADNGNSKRRRSPPKRSPRNRKAGAERVPHGRAGAAEV